MPRRPRQDLPRPKRETRDARVAKELPFAACFLAGLLIVTGVVAFKLATEGDAWWLNAMWLPVSRGLMFGGLLMLDAGTAACVWVCLAARRRVIAKQIRNVRGDVTKSC